MGLLDVTRPDARRLARRRSCWLARPVARVLERNGRHHRTKDLFLYNLHVLGCVHKHVGLTKYPLSPCRLPPTTALAPSDNPSRGIGNPIQLFLGDERAHVGGGFQARAYPDFFSLRRDAFNDFVEDFLFDVET